MKEGNMKPKHDTNCQHQWYWISEFEPYVGQGFIGWECEDCSAVKPATTQEVLDFNSEWISDMAVSEESFYREVSSLLSAFRLCVFNDYYKGLFTRRDIEQKLARVESTLEKLRELIE